MAHHELAIIIPAYKEAFLHAALLGISEQTCKDFTLYIGDDCSPYQLKPIIDSFQDKIDIVYKRFDDNLGSKDLVAQWERCIGMTQGEEWIWLFSDDDIMDPDCVKQFYQVKDTKLDAKLIHYDVRKIDCQGQVLETFPSFGNYITCKEYVDRKLNGELVSFVVEFIVHRNIYTQAHGFESFDLAWGSDFISWVKFSDLAEGIYSCPSAYVNWRSSGINISTNTDATIIYRKMKAVITYTTWLLRFTQKKKWGKQFFYSKYMFGELARNRDKVNTWDLLSLFFHASRSLLLNIRL